MTLCHFGKINLLLSFICLSAALVLADRCPASQSAQLGLPVQSEGSLSFFVDACQFTGHEGKTSFELYYAIELAEFVDLDSASEATVDLSLDVIFVNSARDTIVKTTERKSVDLTAFSADNTVSSYVDLLRFEFNPGDVELTFRIADKISGKSGFLTTNYEVRNFTHDLSLSDLILSVLVSKADEKHIFEKGGLVIVPEVARTFNGGRGADKLFVYYEINNLASGNEPSFYRIVYNVSDLQGNPVLSGGKAKIPKSGTNAARVEVLPLTELKSGYYKLTILLSDLDTHGSSSGEAYFSYQSGSDAGIQLLAMEKEDVQKYYDQIKYLATSEEKKLYWQLSAQGKQEFILRFWRSRDPDQDTPENEFMQEYFNRFKYCEQEISGGLNSDMGRIYVTFGEPLERERKFSSREYDKPVEIWTYAIDGRIEFVFVDRSGDGRYILVHSTHKDELHNPNWQNELN